MRCRLETTVAGATLEDPDDGNPNEADEEDPATVESGGKASCTDCSKGVPIALGETTKESAESSGLSLSGNVVETEIARRPGKEV